MGDSLSHLDDLLVDSRRVLYTNLIYVLTESPRVNTMKCYTRNLNSYNKGAATMFLRGLRANPAVPRIFTVPSQGKGPGN